MILVIPGALNSEGKIFNTQQTIFNVQQNAAQYNAAPIEH